MFSDHDTEYGERGRTKSICMAIPRTNEREKVRIIADYS